VAKRKAVIRNEKYGDVSVTIIRGGKEREYTGEQARKLIRVLGGIHPRQRLVVIPNA
jgi:hypothetical protein